MREVGVVSPLSGSARVESVRTIGAETLVDGWRRAFDLDISTELPADRVTLYRCLDTDLEFFRPAAAQGSAELYARLQQFDWYYDPTVKRQRGRRPPIRWEHRMALEDLSDATSVLEVGCGRGEFLAAAGDRPIEATGLEINPRAAREARRRGCDVLEADLLDYSRTHAGTRSAICSFQTLEHIAEPLPFLEAMVRLLRPGGLLLIAVPNGASYLRHLPDNWLDMPPHHMLRWSPAALSALTRILPLELRRLRREPLAAYNVNGWVSAARHRIRCRWGTTVARVLLNRYAASVARGALDLGLRRLLDGHSIYAAFERSTQHLDRPGPAGRR